MNTGIKKAKILILFPHGIRVSIDGHIGFVKRCDIDWKNPDIDVFSQYKEGDETDVAVLPFYNNNLLLSIKHVKYDPWDEFISAYKIQDVYGDKLEALLQASNKEQTSEKTDTKGLAASHSAGKYSVLLIENEPNQANTLKDIFDKLGITSDIQIVANNSLHDLENKLQNIENYTCVFIDKHLGAENGTKYAASILKSNPYYPVIMITAEDKVEAVNKLKLENLYDKVFLLVKPVHDKEIVAALEWSQKSYVERLNTTAMIDDQQDGIQDILESALIEKILHNLCDVGSKKAVILEMDSTTMEISLLFFSGLEENDWSKYKTTIKHTPIFDTIKQKKPHVFDNIPEKRKKHFPLEIKEAKSLIGVPLKVFEETNYGLFIFDLKGETPISNTKQSVLAIAEKISLLLERYLFKKEMITESRFKTMGVLYAAMRHEILSLMRRMEDRKNVSILKFIDHVNLVH